MQGGDGSHPRAVASASTTRSSPASSTPSTSTRKSCDADASDDNPCCCSGAWCAALASCAKGHEPSRGPLPDLRERAAGTGSKLIVPVVENHRGEVNRGYELRIRGPPDAPRWRVYQGWRSGQGCPEGVVNDSSADISGSVFAKNLHPAFYLGVPARGEQEKGLAALHVQFYREFPPMKLLTVAEAAERLHLSGSTVRAPLRLLARLRHEQHGVSREDPDPRGRH